MLESIGDGPLRRSAMSVARANDDGSLHVRTRLTIPAVEVDLRMTTSGGPGGQHANRSQTKVVASFDVVASTVVSDADREMLLLRVGHHVRASSSRFRSQSANKAAALDALAQKISAALLRQPPRRATRRDESRRPNSPTDRSHRSAFHPRPPNRSRRRPIADRSPANDFVRTRKQSRRSAQ